MAKLGRTFKCLRTRLHTCVSRPKRVRAQYYPRPYTPHTPKQGPNFDLVLCAACLARILGGCCLGVVTIKFYDGGRKVLKKGAGTRQPTATSAPRHIDFCVFSVGWGGVVGGFHKLGGTNGPTYYDP